MRIYYFIHTTGTDLGISGVPRVVKNLARELCRRPNVELIPVCWSAELRAVVHAEQKLLDNFSRHGGPKLEETSQSRQAIAPEAGDWLLIAEAPHLHSYFAEYPPILIDQPIGYVRRFGAKSAVVLHDLLPLTHAAIGKRGAMFADFVTRGDRGDGEEMQRLRFTGYAHALALADIVLPVSCDAGALLTEWLVGRGHRPELLPPIAPFLLPEEILGVKRVAPRRGRQVQTNAGESHAPIDFVTLGTVSAHKNQLAAMWAFLKLIERRPDLNLRLNVVGAVTPDLAVPVSLLAKRAKGSIVLHGKLHDRNVQDLMKRARATVFVSLAEGYGLPVAESLWCGTPCLCSGEGSILEIANAGGCLTVNPRSLEEIERGLETLAVDFARYEALRQQIANRRMKTWSQYSGEVFEALAAVDSGRSVSATVGEGRTGFPSVVAAGLVASDEADEGPDDKILALPASDFNVPKNEGGSTALYSRGAIRYDRGQDRSVEQSVLFFGPYIPLAAGRYEFSFDGEIDGELSIAFTANSGELKIAEVAVTTFKQSVRIDLPKAVDQFEIVGTTTPALERMVLRSVFASIQRVPGEAEPSGASAFGRGDEGRVRGLLHEEASPFAHSNEQTATAVGGDRRDEPLRGSEQSSAEKELWTS